MSATDVPKEVIKPVFLPFVFMLSQLPLILRWFVAGVGFLLALSFLATRLMGMDIAIGSLFLLWAVVLGLGLPLLIYFVKQRTYAMTEYRFFEDRLEYAEGFWTIEYKVISYRHITQVSLRRNVIQRWYGLGSLYLSVPNLGHFPSVFPGIVLQDIAQSDTVYQRIQALINSSR